MSISAKYIFLKIEVSELTVHYHRLPCLYHQIKMDSSNALVVYKSRNWNALSCIVLCSGGRPAFNAKSIKYVIYHLVRKAYIQSNRWRRRQEGLALCSEQPDEEADAAKMHSYIKRKHDYLLSHAVVEYRNGPEIVVVICNSTQKIMCERGQSRIMKPSFSVCDKSSHSALSVVINYLERRWHICSYISKWK